MMKFFIIRPFKYKGKTYSRRDKYLDMPYEDAKPFIRRRKLMLSKTQIEVKNDKEISQKPKPDVSKRTRPAKSGKRSGESRV